MRRGSAWSGQRARWAWWGPDSGSFGESDGARSSRTTTPGFGLVHLEAAAYLCDGLSRRYRRARLRRPLDSLDPLVPLVPLSHAVFQGKPSAQQLAGDPQDDGIAT